MVRQTIHDIRIRSGTPCPERRETNFMCTTIFLGVVQADFYIWLGCRFRENTKSDLWVRKFASGGCRTHLTLDELIASWQAPEEWVNHTLDLLGKAVVLAAFKTNFDISKCNQTQGPRDPESSESACDNVCPYARSLQVIGISYRYTQMECKKWNRKIRTSYIRDYRAWVSNCTQRIEKADNRGDTREIYTKRSKD